MLLEVRRVTAWEEWGASGGYLVLLLDLHTSFGVSMYPSTYTCRVLCISNKLRKQKKPGRKGKTSSQRPHFTDEETEAQKGSITCPRLTVVDRES